MVEALGRALLLAFGTVGPPWLAHTPVDGGCAAGHVTGPVAENERDALGDLLRRSQPFLRQVSCSFLELFLGEELPFTRCVYPARVDDVDPDAVWGEFHRRGT